MLDGRLHGGPEPGIVVVGIESARIDERIVAPEEIVDCLPDVLVEELRQPAAVLETPGRGGAGATGRRPRFFPAEFDWVVGCTYRGMPEEASVVRNLIGANMSFRRSALEAIGGCRDALTSLPGGELVMLDEFGGPPEGDASGRERNTVDRFLQGLDEGRRRMLAGGFPDHILEQFRGMLDFGGAGAIGVFLLVVGATTAWMSMKDAMVLPEGDVIAAVKARTLARVSIACFLIVPPS